MTPADPSQALPARTVGDELRARAQAIPDHAALLWAEGDEADALEGITYRELLQAAEVAAATISEHAKPGDRVAVWAANGPKWIIVELGSALAGTVLTGFNTAWSDDEVRHALSLTSPRLLFAGADNRRTDLRDRARELAAEAEGCLSLDLETIETRPDPTSFEGPRVDPEDPFLIQFTSGTTGRAKGATLSHRTCLHAGRIRALTIDAGGADVWLNPVPLHHVGGSVVIVLGALTSGGTYVAMSRFDPGKQVAMMRATGATRTGGVPTMFYALLATPGIDEALEPIRSVGLGGTSVPPSLVEELQKRGAAVSVAYAQSECPMITQSDPAGDATHVATTCGVTVPHTELRILDGGGHELGTNQVGEVCVRSPLVMLGYWDDPEATVATFDEEGFLHTGDLGSLDEEGVLRIHGRAREVIIRGGENVYPIEVEDVLLRHPAVDSVAVLARPSKRWGEEVAAVATLTSPGAATADELMEYAAGHLAHFKVPRYWRFVDEMPLTASGKIRKVELAPLFADGGD